MMKKKIHLFTNTTQVLFVLGHQAFFIQLRGIHLLRDVF